MVSNVFQAYFAVSYVGILLNSLDEIAIKMTFIPLLFQLHSSKSFSENFDRGNYTYNKCGRDNSTFKLYTNPNSLIYIFKKASHSKPLVCIITTVKV